ncbi:hypothetical protein GIW50_03255 [Pseudomonas syringae]|uniref:Uncharacterized protein n=1 Tax=Pseudomonas syringae TaxID=317 RepID=A0A9Q3ZY02_PSESX|nr:hypothetical protein [Pseudomonas syringae]MCF5062037.1 hypothetical protein [Pseudomonas syringae]MCF5075145.1 hypothetical protein [Pseudomonas syringae]MCF5117423.1 hypothetical protein [Pseudomonas syringae]MCF5379581.1 hypothetical protein [Pseudomonas syringae]
MDIDYDTSDWLGCPTPEEMYKHQCALLEDEFAEVQAQLTKARKNIAGLIKMNDALVAGKASAEKALAVALADVCRLNRENSEMGARIVGLISVVDQRDHLFRENQRLLSEIPQTQALSSTR